MSTELEVVTSQPASTSRRKEIEAFVRDLDPLLVQGENAMGLFGPLRGPLSNNVFLEISATKKL